MNYRPSVRFPLHVLAALAVLALLTPASLAGQPGRDTHFLRPAGVITVTSTADSGPGTLHQALLTAQNGDTITFDPAAFPAANPATIALVSGLP